MRLISIKEKLAIPVARSRAELNINYEAYNRYLSYENLRANISKRDRFYDLERILS